MLYPSSNPGRREAEAKGLHAAAEERRRHFDHHLGILSYLIYLIYLGTVTGWLAGRWFKVGWLVVVGWRGSKEAGGWLARVAGHGLDRKRPPLDVARATRAHSKLAGPFPPLVKCFGSGFILA